MYIVLILPPKIPWARDETIRADPQYPYMADLDCAPKTGQGRPSYLQIGALTL